MKRTGQLLASLICFALGQAPVQAATNYWDIDGVTPGAGGPAPAGTWDTGATANWTTNSSGASAGTTWAANDDAIFSAGTDATGAFTITLDGDLTAGNLTVEEGDITFSGGNSLDIGGGVAGKGIINVAFGATNTINTPLTGGDSNNQITKMGPGRLVLTADNFFGTISTNVVAEGILVVANDSALGSSSVPTIVSNGAALHLSAGRNMVEGVILNGSGVANTGALRSSAVNSTWNGGVILGSDARIETGGARFDFGNYHIVGTNGGNNFNLTIGGDGGRIRLNNSTAAAYDAPFNIGTGAFTKEGTCLLQLENTNICGAFYFNGGDIYPRNEAGTAGFGQGPGIYVGAGAGAFRASFQDVVLGYGLSLAAGADLGFDCGASWTLTVEGVISGLGGLAKKNTGILSLTNANTYSGNTTILLGTLTLGTSGSISNTAVIDIQTNTATFDVSSKISGFVLGAAQTLKGNGTVQGNVKANGTIAPGASVGTLAFGGNLTLAGNLSIEVDKSLSPSNDVITVTGTLSHSGGGTVTVVNLGPGLAVNDSFQIFSQAVSGGQTIAVTGAGAIWTNRLNFDGSIAVVSLAPPAVPATNLTIAAVGPASFSLGGSGAANSAYKVYASTNVTTPMTNWWLIGTTNSSAGGVIQFLDPQATNAQRFYRFGQ